MPDNSSLLLDIADVLLFVSSLAVWAIVFWRWRTGRRLCLTNRDGPSHG